MRSSFKAALLLAACASSPAHSQSGTFGFDAYRTIPGALPGPLSIGDVTGDSRDDLVVLDTDVPGDDRVRIYAQQADGTPGAAQIVSLGRPLAGRAGTLLLADLDGRAGKEIVVGYAADLVGMAGSGIAIVRDDGAGGYGVRTYADQRRSRQLAASDVDRDGATDLVAVAPDEGVVVYYGDGLGGVRNTTAHAAAAGEARELRIGDVNGDGNDDVVVSVWQPASAPEFAVYRHDGTGHLLPPVAYGVAGNARAAGIAVGDVTGDARRDVVLSRADGAANQLWLFRQDAGGVLQAPETLASAVSPGILAAVDLDRDGLTDLATMYDNRSARLGYRLHGVGGLGAERIVPLAPANRYLPGYVAFGDLDGDGCTDAAVASVYSSIVGSARSVEVLAGRDCAPNADLAADIDVGERGFTVVVSHRGGMTEPSARVRVAIRTGLRGGAVVAPRECVGAPSLPGNPAYDCDAGMLALGERASFDFVPARSGKIAIAATASGDLYDPEPANDTANASAAF